jgi:hypothetical protein
MSLLQRATKVVFNPRNAEHMIAYKNYMGRKNQNGESSPGWDGHCPFSYSFPNMSVIDEINKKIVGYALEGIA